jgi:hypothetical protein
MRQTPVPRLLMLFGVLLAGLELQGCASADRPPSGHWTTQLPMGDADSVHLILDLGVLGSRWVGEFDVPEFEAENYPAAVWVAGPRVKLQFSGTGTEFDGRLSKDGKRISGIAYFEGDSLAAELLRTGEAQFSDGFLAFEAAAEDSARVTRLSADGGELRNQFNADRGRTRLLMLLSPS